MPKKQVDPFQLAINNNLKLLGQLDPKVLAREYFTLNLESGLSPFRYGVGLGQWWWIKKGFSFESNDDLVQTLNAFSYIWSTNEDAFKWEQKFNTQLDLCEREMVTKIVDEIVTLVKVDTTKAELGVHQDDVSFYLYKLNFDPRGKLKIIVRLINDKLQANRKRVVRLSEETKHLVLERDDYTCKNCGVKQSEGFTMHVDHITPVSKGGTDRMDNLQTLCPKCNVAKSDH